MIVTSPFYFLMYRFFWVKSQQWRSVDNDKLVHFIHSPLLRRLACLLFVGVWLCVRRRQRRRRRLRRPWKSLTSLSEPICFEDGVFGKVQNLWEISFVQTSHSQLDRQIDRQEPKLIIFQNETYFCHVADNFLLLLIPFSTSSPTKKKNVTECF